jgi:hypothetical protein
MVEEVQNGVIPLCTKRRAYVLFSSALLLLVRVYVRVYSACTKRLNGALSVFVVDSG